MKKNDFILVIAILLIAGIGFLMYLYFAAGHAGTVLVTANGEVYGTYSLKKDREIIIQGGNTLVIRDGEADMTDADCPDHICVDHKPISKKKETIVCLPNKVIVEIVGGEDAETDAVAN